LLAQRKALEISAARPGALVLGSDTLVELDGEVLGKPADEAAARAMLRRQADLAQRRQHHELQQPEPADPEGLRQPPADDAGLVHRAVRYDAPRRSRTRSR